LPARSLFDLALPVRPAHERHSGIGVAQIDVVRIGPGVGRRARAHSRREDFDQSSVFKPGGCIVSIREKYGIAMTGAMPIPNDTTHTKVKARAFASERAA
jgi:hypothetical protein